MVAHAISVALFVQRRRILHWLVAIAWSTRLASDLTQRALEVPDCIHPLMQNTDNRDAILGRPEIDDMMLSATPPIAWPDMGAILSLLGSLG